MAALHGREDVLLEPTSFLRLLRQANDAEVADVRLVSEGEYEVSPHKSDLAMQVRPMPDPNAAPGSAAAMPARPAAALRYRSGSQATKRGGQLAMVGVVQLDGDAPAPATVAATTAAPIAEPVAKKSAGRGAKPKAKAAAAPAKKPAAPKEAKAAKVAKPVAKVAKAAAAKAAPKAGGRKPATKPKSTGA